jgi:hypothetical protein
MSPIFTSGLPAVLTITDVSFTNSKGVNADILD